MIPINLLRLPMTVCAWCRIVMREGSLPISHGMCLDCQAVVEGDAP